MNHETTARESDLVLDRLCQHQKAITLAEKTLQEECQQMGRLLADLKSQHQSSHGQRLAELEVLRMGNECLQELVAERDRQLEALNQQLAATARDDLPPVADPGEVQALREQVKEKDALIEELRQARQETPPESLVGVDDHDYEAELTRFRRQLEADRKELNEEIEQLRARNVELNDAVQEAELQLSRERAQLARERV